MGKIKWISAPELLCIKGYIPQKVKGNIYPYKDDYGIPGHSKYLNMSGGWWNCYVCSNFEGKLPRTLGEFSKYINNPKETLQFFREKKYLNLIICQCACCHGAEPMIRYKHCENFRIKNGNRTKEFSNGQLLNDILKGKGCYKSDIVTDVYNIDLGLHLFWIDRNEKDIYKSKLICIGKYIHLYINN